MLAAKPKAATIAVTARVSPTIALRTGVALRPCPGSSASLVPARAEHRHAERGGRGGDPRMAVAPGELGGPQHRAASLEVRHAGIPTQANTAATMARAPTTRMPGSMNTPGVASKIRASPSGVRIDNANAPATAIGRPEQRHRDRGEQRGADQLPTAHPERSQHRGIRGRQQRPTNQDLSQHQEGRQGGQPAEQAQHHRLEGGGTFGDRSFRRGVEPERLRSDLLGSGPEGRRAIRSARQLEHAGVTPERFVPVLVGERRNDAQGTRGPVELAGHDRGPHHRQGNGDQVVIRGLISTGDLPEGIGLRDLHIDRLPVHGPPRFGFVTPPHQHLLGGAG